jgi:hypothetical protein
VNCIQDNTLLHIITLDDCIFTTGDRNSFFFHDLIFYLIIIQLSNYLSTSFKHMKSMCRSFKALACKLQELVLFCQYMSLFLTVNYTGCQKKKAFDPIPYKIKRNKTKFLLQICNNLNL